MKTKPPGVHLKSEVRLLVFCFFWAIRVSRSRSISAGTPLFFFFVILSLSYVICHFPPGFFPGFSLHEISLFLCSDRAEVKMHNGAFRSVQFSWRERGRNDTHHHHRVSKERAPKTGRGASRGEEREVRHAREVHNAQTCPPPMALSSGGRGCATD